MTFLKCSRADCSSKCPRTYLNVWSWNLEAICKWECLIVAAASRQDGELHHYWSKVLGLYQHVGRWRAFEQATEPPPPPCLVSWGCCCSAVTVILLLAFPSKLWFSSPKLTSVRPDVEERNWFLGERKRSDGGKTEISPHWWLMGEGNVKKGTEQEWKDLNFFFWGGGGSRGRQRPAAPSLS